MKEIVVERFDCVGLRIVRDENVVNVGVGVEYVWGKVDIGDERVVWVVVEGCWGELEGGRKVVVGDEGVRGKDGGVVDEGRLKIVKDWVEVVEDVVDGVGVCCD